VNRQSHLIARLDVPYKRVERGAISGVVAREGRKNMEQKSEGERQSE
jgi:hypothetical protein